MLMLWAGFLLLIAGFAGGAVLVARSNATMAEDFQARLRHLDDRVMQRDVATLDKTLEELRALLRDTRPGTFERKQLTRLIAIASMDRGDLEAARDAFVESLAIEGHVVSPERTVIEHEVLAGIADSLDEPKLAAGQRQAAAALRQKIEHEYRRIVARDGVATRLKALEDVVLTEGTMFSVSRTLSELGILKELAAPNSLERKRTLRLVAIIEGKQGKLEEARDAWIASLAIDAPGMPPADLVLDHNGLADAASELEEYALAAKHYAAAAQAAAGLAEFSEDQRLGMQEKRGYALHEAGDYAQALAVNREVLAGGERLFGLDGAELTTVLTNIAQNLHALRRLDEAQAILLRGRDIAAGHGTIEVEQDMMFQLGVLAFESGKPEEARRWMQQRVDLLARRGQKARLRDAREDLAELERRLR